MYTSLNNFFLNSYVYIQHIFQPTLLVSGTSFLPSQHSTLSHTHAIFVHTLFDFVCDCLTVLRCIIVFLFFCHILCILFIVHRCIVIGET
jgi:hypothetical protein